MKLASLRLTILLFWPLIGKLKSFATIRYHLILLRPGEIGLLCALNTYDSYWLHNSLNSIGNVHEEFEDLNRLQEYTGISKFSLTFVLFYVYISRSSIQNLLVTLNKKFLQLCSTFIFTKTLIKQSWGKIANKSIKSSSENTSWTEQITIHFYCVIRISMHNIQLTEIDAENESERFTRKLSFSWRRKALKPYTNIMKKLHDWPALF